MSLSCALLATSLHQWARRYLRLTQPARCSPEKRARIRAFFADGLDRMHVPWAVEGLPTLLHLSLFLFFGGLVIFLFHVDHDVFGSVVWWIGLFSMVYVSITLLPLIRHDSPYCAPLSTPAWFLYAGISYVTFKTLYLITNTCYNRYPRTQTWAHWIQPWERWHLTWVRWLNSSDRYRRWMLGGVERAAEETASEQLLEIDTRIFDWTVSALGDDISLEKFFEAIPGFVNSNLVHDFREHLSDNLLDRLSKVAHGFMDRTWSSNSVSDSEKHRRLDIVTNAMGLIRVSDVTTILRNILFEYWSKVPQSIEVGHTLARWCTSDDHYTALYAQSIIGWILGIAQERNDSWFTLAASAISSGLAEHDLRDDIADGGDSMLLAILIQVTRRSYSSGDVVWEALVTLCKLDINKTLPRLQHDFCTLWNEIVQKARSGNLLAPVLVLILKLLYPLYIALHQGIDAASSASTYDFYTTPFEPSAFPSCNIASHHSDSTARLPVLNSNAVFLPIQSRNSPDALSPSPSSGRIVSQQVGQGNIIAAPPFPSNSTTSQDLSAIPHAFPISSGPPLSFASPPAADVCDNSLRGSHDQNQTIPMEVFHHQTQSLRLVPLPPDTASNSLEHKGD
jgi:Family of unknown function (DUF6535)